MTTPEGSVYAYRKGSDDRLLKAVNPNAYSPETDDGEGMTFDYDATGRRIRVHYPDGGCERYFLDGNGNIIKRVQPEQYDEKTDDGPGYTYEYDAAGRLTRVSDPYGRQIQQYTYDEAGYITCSVDARAAQEAEESGHDAAGTLYRYNLAGWLMEKREPIERNADGSISYRLTTYTYDRMGNMLAEKRYISPQELAGMSGATHTISYEYDRSNRLVKVSDCTGAAMTYHYGKQGLVDSEKVRTGEDTWRETRYIHDAQGRVLKSATVLGDNVYAITEYAYDLNGNITQIRLPEGGKISYTYDAEDRCICERHEGEGISNETTYVYDHMGNLTGTTDAQGRTEHMAYDLANRQIRHTAKDGGIRRTIYDRNGNVIKQVAPVQYLTDGAGFTYRYDLCNRTTGVTAPDGTETETTAYNSAGDITRRTDGTGSGISMTYDLMGRRLRAVTDTGSSQGWEYDAMGNVASTTDGLGNRTEFTLDRWGRITGIRKADGSRESYTYDHMGNMTSSTDGEGHTTYMEYDAPGRLTGRTDPAGRTEHYQYDMEDRLSAGVDRNGNTTRYTYNMYGSLTGRTTVSADGTGSITESFGYYPDGKLRYAIGGGMRYDYRYDAEGRLTEKSASGRTLLSYEYDLNGNRTGMTDVTGKRTGYRYNSRDLLEEITDNGKSLARYRYNADGTIKRLEVGGTLVTEYGYDADRNITSQRTVISGMESMGGTAQGTLPFMGSTDGFTKPCTLVDNTYTYDSNANRITKQTLSGITSFSYDSVNRLVSASYPKCSEEYRYDRAGNRTARTWNTMDGTHRREESYTYDPCNRLMTHDITDLRADGTQENRKNVYAYDLQGNLLSDGDRQYSYDVMNRLAEVRNADGSWQRNHYDGEGLRAELEENGRLVRFIYDGDKAVLEETDSSTIRHIRGYELVQWCQAVRPAKGM